MLNQLRTNPEFKKQLDKGFPFIGLTNRAAVIKGSLYFVDGVFQFHHKTSKTRVMNNEILLLYAEFEDQNFIAQCLTLRVFKNHVELTPLDPRLHKRRKIPSQSSIAFLDENQTDSLLSGEQRIQRLRYHKSSTGKDAFYISKDITKSESKLSPSLSHELRYHSATMVDISEGGIAYECNLSNSTVVEKKPKLALVQTTLQIGNKKGIISSYAAVREFKKNSDDTHFISCSFSEPLKKLPKGIVDGCPDLSFVFNRSLDIKLNGERHQVNNTITLKVPYGHHSLVLQKGNREPIKRTIDLLPNDKNEFDLSYLLEAWVDN